MKIFGWLHRRMYANMDYYRVPHNKTDVHVDGGSSAVDGNKKAGTEKEALLELSHVTSIQRVLDGILTIGTLGHLDGQCHQVPLGADEGVTLELPADTAVSGEEGKEEEEQLEILDASAEHPNHCLATESFRKEMLALEDVKTGIAEIGAVEEEQLLEPLLRAKEADKRGRVTLADLLAAERLQSEKADPSSRATPTSAKTAPANVVNGVQETTVIAASLSCGAANCQALNKKLLPWKKGKELSPPGPKKLHQRIRRMLKKKIHPDVARNMQPCGGEQGSHDKAADESVSLI